jgi:PhzF family phenazine biosynthesis protein
MKIPFYWVDAFTSKVFHGNPAAVCPLAKWLDDEVLQAMAAENNLSETAFLIGSHGRFALRWFTPKTEVDLCGHATLAAAYVVLEFLDSRLSQVEFSTQSGVLRVGREGNLLSMDFPARPPAPCEVPGELVKGLGLEPREVLKSRDYVAVYESEDQIKAMLPRMDQLLKMDGLGVIVTAPGEEADFVSRFFAPKVGVPEDPVTGSAHCTLVPYWAKRLNKNKLKAYQLSPRGGELFCEDLGGRVKIAGQAVLYMEGTIHF